MKIKTYLANIKVWDFESQSVKTYQDRVIPTVVGIATSYKELPSGLKGGIYMIHDRETKIEYMLKYIPLSNPIGRTVFSCWEIQSYSPNYLDPEMVEIIPGTEEEFETEQIKLITAEENSCMSQELRDTIGLKRYADLEDPNYHD